MGYRLSEIMKKRNKQQTVSNRAKYPLTGISFCAKCGGMAREKIYV
ncbi:hypothetical protein BLGI_1593 [Brevibacillus laterosporus GI-9]|nr:hypothetical protein BLGI_1593 [Brevibacillus laterosporus GI-9]